MVDFGKFAKKAQDALAQGSEKIEAALKDNAGKIEGAVDKAGQFAKDKMPDRAAQIDNATAKAKAAVPRHEDGTPVDPSTATGYPAAAPAPSSTGAPVPPATPAPSVPPTHTAADTAAPSWSPPGQDTSPTPPAPPAPPTHTPPTPPSPTPEVDRAAREQG